MVQRLKKIQEKRFVNRRNLEFGHCIGETKTFNQFDHRHFEFIKQIVMVLGLHVKKNLMRKKPVCQSLADKAVS